MPNHAHALLRTGAVPLSRFAQRWLGGYATSFNRLHRRAGHLFQNRFKNTLVEEEAYLLELVRYIHLNPVRSRLSVTIDDLDRYPWTGHTVLLGHRQFLLQDAEFVLAHFGRKVGKSRRAYRQFVREGAAQVHAPDLDGGGLCRSAGGWELVPKLGRGRERWAFDERVLGGSGFVHEVLGRCADDPPPRPPSDPRVLLDRITAEVAQRCEVTDREIASPTLRRDVLKAQALVCDLAIRRHGLTLTAVARHLDLSVNSIARALTRAKPLVEAAPQLVARIDIA